MLFVKTNFLKQIARVEHFMRRTLGMASGSEKVHLERKGELYLGTTASGARWHVPYNNPALVSWALNFRSRNIRFESNELLEEGDFVVDVGSCTGEYTLYAAECVGSTGRVLAFEPDPKYYQALVANAKLYGFDWVECKNVACGPKAGEMQLHRIENAMGGGSLDEEYLEQYSGIITGTMSVPVTTLDAEYSKFDKGLIKVLAVTANNYEYDILTAGNEMLRRTKYLMYQSIHHDKICRLVEGLGFVLVEQLSQGQSPAGQDIVVALHENKCI